jgi:Holliday junction resolvase
VPAHSRNKGKRGEREAAQALRDLGYEAKRGVQYAGGPDSPDVISDFPFHVEVKRVERLQLWSAYQQALKDATAAGRPPCVLHRASRQPWLITMSLEDFHNHKGLNKNTDT